MLCLFYIPNVSAKYALLETGIRPLYFQTLRLLLNYIIKILNSSDQSLKKQLAHKIISKGMETIAWASDLRKVSTRIGIEFQDFFDTSGTKVIGVHSPLNYNFL